MNAIAEKLTEASLRYKRVAREIMETYEARQPATTSQVTPNQLNEAIEQFMAVSATLDKEEGETGPIYKDDVSQLGDYGITLMMDLAAWAAQLGLSQLQHELEDITLSIADWIVRHDGEIRTLEPIVNSLARLANRTHDPAELQSLCNFMSRIIGATANIIKQDLEHVNPGRPWRLLNLNRGIAATRSHDALLMEKVFDELSRYLPEDAGQFFAEGMEQMEALNYPTHVRAVMQRYFDRFTRRAMH